MKHLVIPLDPNHTQPLGELVLDVATAGGLAIFETPDPHVTLVAYSGLTMAAARRAIASVVASTRPFIVHAHGYGIFTGSKPSALSLHVPVARTPALDKLHRRLCAALRRAGADVAPWSAPPLWSPHITLLDRSLDPESLGRAVAWLARRHHPSWQIPVDRVALLGSWPDRYGPCDVVRFEAGPGRAPGAEDGP